MIRAVFALLALLVATPVLACTVPQNAKAIRAETIALANNERSNRGRKIVRANVQLTDAAQSHACWMADTGTFSHAGANGSSIGDRARGAGYAYSFLAENIAFGDQSAGQVVARWMQSRDHRNNILSRKIQQAGIGIAAGADGRLYWVMMIGRLQ